MPGITLQEVGGQLSIAVPDESTVIGRGPFLQVSDKRVSRSHARLEVTDGKLYITPTHTNPCFLRPSSSKEQKVLTREVKQVLEHGDEFGLLPDQLFYRVNYKQVNGQDSDKVKDESKELPKEDLKEEKISNGDSKENEGKEKDDSKAEPDEDWDKSADDFDKTKIEEKEEEKEKEQDEPKTTSEKIFKRDGQGDMAMPLDKKRDLPDWMKKAADTPSPTKASQKKPTAVSKRTPGTKVKKSYAEDDDEEEDEEEEEKEVYVPKKRSKVTADSDEDFVEEDSDDDYEPEKKSRGGRGGGKRKKKASDSEEEEDFSDDDDDDYAPSKKKAKPAKKATPKKGRGKGGKGKRTPARSPRKAPQRGSRRKITASDDEDEDEEITLPRRRGHVDDEEESSGRRPQRAAKQKRGSYVDDPMIEEALSDFASEDDEDPNEDKDSDFQLEGEDDSGSDWGSSKKAGKSPKGRGPPRGPLKRSNSKAGKRSKRRQTYSDDDEDLEDDEPYVPRPSKRRGGGKVSQDTDDDDDDQKKKRRREKCQYGKKCYRKNPVHFRTFCHPGDSSYDDEDSESPSAKESAKKDKDASRASPEKPSRPQRSTAGTRLVTTGVDDDDDLPDTYDYNDSFIDDGTQKDNRSEGGEDDSDYDAEEDVKALSKEAKKFIKNKKMAKPVGQTNEPEES